MSNYATLKAAISTAIKQNGNDEITGQVLQTTLLSMVDSLVSGYLFKGIATPSTVVGTPDENVFWIAPAGSYSNFGATPIDVPTGCIGIFQYNGSFTNSVVYVGGTVDISALSHTAYASLSQALGDLPSALHIGGIEVRYQDSTTSKFVKYRLMATSWSTVEDNWQGVDDEPTAGSDNLVKSGGINDYHNNKIQLAQGNGTDWSKVILKAVVKNWSGGDKRIYLDLVYRNDAVYASGVMLYICNNDFSNPSQAVYWEGLRGTRNGLEWLDFLSINGGYGEISVLINWDAIPNAFNDVITPKYYIDLIPYDGVSFTHQQNLTNAEKKQARDNIGFEQYTPESLLDALSVSEEETAWQLPNDTFDGVYSYEYIGQYTRLMDEDTYFSKVRINYIGLSEKGVIAYKIYIVKGIANSQKNDAPEGAISSSTHTLIAEGNLTIDYIKKPYDIELNKVVCCPKGQQVVAYLVGESGIRMTGASAVTPPAYQDRNVSIICLGSNPYSGSSWIGFDMDYFNMALTLLIDEEYVLRHSIINNLKPTIPELIYAIPDTELNIWNDTVALSVDRGLASPLNYRVEWHSNKGYITERGYRFEPTVADVGQTYYVECLIYDMRNILAYTKGFYIKVLSKSALAQSKNMVFFGDSLGSTSAANIWTDFNNQEKFSGVAPTMLGTRLAGGTDYIHFEGAGGYSWDDFATEGRKAYRLSVSGITNIGLYSEYLIVGTSYQVTVREVNITGGTGNILVEYDRGAEIPSFTTSGILSKVSGTGDDSISYTNGSEEPNNPLWNAITNQLDISLYKERLGLQATDKIDCVAFQLGINNNTLFAHNETLLEEYISELYNAFITDNPNCVFILGLNTSAGNTVDGAGANYGASYNIKEFLTNMYIIRNAYLRLANSGKYPNMFICPTHLEMDRYYGYTFEERVVSQRNATIEKVHNNYVHPGGSPYGGYGQIGDAFFATIIGALTE